MVARVGMAVFFIMTAAMAIVRQPIPYASDILVAGAILAAFGLVFGI